MSTVPITSDLRRPSDNADDAVPAPNVTAEPVRDWFESVRGLCKSAAGRRFPVQIDLLRIERAVGVEPFTELSS